MATIPLLAALLLLEGKNVLASRVFVLGTVLGVLNFLFAIESFIRRKLVAFCSRSLFWSHSSSRVGNGIYNAGFQISN